MKIFYCLALFGLTASAVFAQNDSPPVFPVMTDTGKDIMLANTYWQALEDKGSKWTINDVSNTPLANSFKTTAPGTKVDFSIHTYWLRYRIKNMMNKDAKISIPSQVEYNDLYIKTADKEWLHYKTGSLVPWSERQGLKQMDRLYFSLAVKQGEEIEIYERRNSSYRNDPIPGDLNLTIGFTDTIIQEYYDSGYFKGVNNSFVFGLLLFACIFNLFFFYTVHEKAYLYFSLYLFFLGITRFESEFYNVFFREYPIIFQYIDFFVWQFIIFFLTHFVRHLLDIPAKHPNWNKFLIVLNIIPLILHPVRLLIQYPDLNLILYLSNEIVAIVLLFTFFFFRDKHDKSTPLLSRAVLPAFSLWVLGLGLFTIPIVLNFWFGVAIPDSLENSNWHDVETIVVIIMIISFSWVLFHRFTELRQQITQQALEREMERSALIRQQNEALEQKVTERTAELKQSLDNLRSTQSQLIQSEKMASLGELTAGIAHEIQNPLNFVNNFSDINTELINEQLEELKAGNIEDAIDIANDIKQNEDKINHHGKRADAIVKGMLQHSQKSTGQKEPTDINKLADEYLRLAYHGLRAKNKDFNAEIKTDFDEAIGVINIIPQDIGRVLLNLLNNAFYAVNEKQKAESLKPKADGSKYKPAVTVSTKKADDKIIIIVKDNGNGIPEKIKEKIFQPFFTTKPTGSGTGLGLSLSYDIIKAHGGAIKVETREGEGTSFTISIPLTETTL